MARPGPASYAKRVRELKKKEKQEAKREKRAMLKALKNEAAPPDIAPGEDPDIAGIVPGPQPPRY